MLLDTNCPYCGKDTALGTSVVITTSIMETSARVIEKHATFKCPHCGKTVTTIMRYKLDVAITVTKW